MRLAFLFGWFVYHLWSPPEQVSPKVVLVNVPAGRETEVAGIVQARFPRRSTIRLYVDAAPAMERLLDDHDAVVPAFRPASRFHYGAVYAPYSAVLPYERFLRLEENTANLLIACLRDPRPVRYVFFWRDGCWLSESSVVSYLTSEERGRVFRLLSLRTDSIEPVAAPDARVWFLPEGAEI
ncbi:hypothetical protein EBZ80_04975 [bacterium]|nr:hypothetical protein [bacterium]